MDDFELEIKKDFINEALMNLEEVESSFMELESASDTKPLLEKIFRMAHNLKGGSRAVGFGDVAEFTHELENLVLKIQKAEVTLCSDMVTTLLKSNDRLVEMLNALRGDMAARCNNDDLIADIKKWISGESQQSVAATVAPVVPAAVAVATTSVEEPAVFESLESKEPIPPMATAFFAGDDLAEIMALSKAATTVAPVKAAAPAPTPTSAPTPEKASDKGGDKEDEVVRVNLSRIDILNDYVGELIVTQSVIQQQSLSGDPNKLHAAVQQMVKISKDIQNISMSLRMLPVKPLVQKLQRVLRDTAKALNKDVQLALDGDQIDVDKSVLDRLADPLIHILRNAVDHGLETTEERSAAGKSTVGKVTLSFVNEGNHLVVQVKDDGKGINPEVLKKKAIEKGIITEGQALTEKQLIHLIFHPGFSTKAVTSEISGRGVGMDVVKTNIDKIGGNVEVTTNLGSGSTFRIQIPLSLAVIEGLVVMNGDNRYIIPLSQVQETINLGAQRVFTGKLGIGSCFELRGSVVPLIPLETLLNAKPHGKESSTALVFNIQDQLIAIQVTEIIRSQQVVIKPLSNGIKAQKGWIGSCVLGDGLPTLILSPADLLQGQISAVLKVNDDQRRTA